MVSKAAEQGDALAQTNLGAMYAEGELTAEAQGLFIAFDSEKFAALLEARDGS